MNAFANSALQRRLAVGAFALVLCSFALTLPGFPPLDLATFLLGRQDRWLLLAQALILIVIGQRIGSLARPIAFSRATLCAAAVLLLAFCYLGHVWALCSYDLSRDEQMAVFDARIFSAGLRAQPLPSFWQLHTPALNTLFMLPVDRPVAWVSAYLPVNALLRALVGAVVDPAFTSPLLTAVGLVALYKCARLLWPDDREAAAIACLLYLTSGQILLAGMTAYAMPAHLTFNLLWLWLFLMRRWQADIVALLIGFAATGLHQPLFHPLFVAPFLLLLLPERAWARLGIYGVGYALICGFWLAWPGWTHAFVAGPNSITATAGTDYWSRLKLVLSANTDPRWFDMSANLLRFVAWQNILLLPLMVAGAALAWRNRMAAALIASFILPIVIMTVIIPFQGYGFGYRYVHGAIGSAILIGVYGWRRLPAEESLVRRLIVRGAIATAIVIVPMQLWMAHRPYAAFASVEARVAASGADYFAVGGADTSFSGDFVINNADLSNRPIRIFAEALQPAFMADLCRTKPRIGLPTTRLFRPIDTYFGARPDPAADNRIKNLTPALEAAGCRVVIVDESRERGF